MPQQPSHRAALAAAVLIAGLGAASPQVRAGAPAPEKVDLFEAGIGGYAHYRIPGIVALPDGAVLAYCEARKTPRGDWGTIDVLLRRSIDGGKTWGPPGRSSSPPTTPSRIPWPQPRGSPARPDHRQ